MCRNFGQKTTESPVVGNVFKKITLKYKRTQNWSLCATSARSRRLHPTESLHRSSTLKPLMSKKRTNLVDEWVTLPNAGNLQTQHGSVFASATSSPAMSCTLPNRRRGMLATICKETTIDRQSRSLHHLVSDYHGWHLCFCGGECCSHHAGPEGARQYGVHVDVDVAKVGGQVLAQAHHLSVWMWTNTQDRIKTRSQPTKMSTESKIATVL